MLRVRLPLVYGFSKLQPQVLAVALGQAVYLWNAASGSIEHLLTLPEQNDFVTRYIYMYNIDRFFTRDHCGCSTIENKMTLFCSVLD